MRCKHIIAALRQAHVSELSSNALEQRNREVCSELQEFRAKQEQFECQHAEAAEICQQRLAKASEELDATQRECWRERELVARSECMLSEVRRAHADELVRVAEELGREDSEHVRMLADRDSEISRLLNLVRQSHMGAKDHHGKPDQIWERRLSEAEQNQVAGLEFAAKYQAACDLAEKSLKECRQELVSEIRCAQGFQSHACGIDEELARARSSIVSAELVAEERRTEELRIQVQCTEGIAAVRV